MRCSAVAVVLTLISAHDGVAIAHFRSLSGRSVSISVRGRWTPIEETHLCLCSRETNAANVVVVSRGDPVLGREDGSR